MDFEIENLEDVIKEAIATISPSSNQVEINEIYNRDIKKIWNEFILENDSTNEERSEQERKVLYMPREMMIKCLRRIYGN